MQALEKVADNIGAGLVILGKDYRVVWANKKLAKRGFVPNKKCFQTFNRTTTCPDCGVRKVFEQSLPFEIHDFKHVSSSGEVTWHELRTTPFKDKNGNIVGALELEIPITERKITEKKISDQTTILTSVLTSANASIMLVDSNYRYILFNETHAKRMKSLYNADIEIGKSLLDFQTIPIDREIAKRNIDRALAGEFVEDIQESGDPHNFRTWISVRHFPVKDETGKIVGASMFAIDLSKQKRVEEALRISEERFYKVFTDSPIAMSLTRISDGILVDMNEACEKLFEYNREETMGRSTRELTVIGEKVFDKISPIIIEKGFLHNLELPLSTKTGKPIKVLVSFNKISVDKQDYVLTTFVNITALRKAEELRVRKQSELKIANEKLQVIGSLTRHDVANKHSIIKYNTYLIKKKTTNQELIKLIDNIETAVNEADKLFEFNRVYEKIGAEKLSRVDVTKSFNDAVELNSETKKLNIVNDCQGLEVVADSLLPQLFYNLVDNSLKHGQILKEIRFTCKQNKKDTVLVYEDDGVGIKAENKTKIFTQGFTTGRGSGLGLSLVKKIVEVYGWTITENGKEGRGARFEINIPNSSVSFENNHKRQ